MKIAFVCFGEEQLGVEYLSAVLKSNGHNTKLFFDPLLFNDFILKIRSFARILSCKPTILKELEKFKPDLICFSVISDHYINACDLAKSIKKTTKAPIVFGGIHPTSVPEEVIKNNFVDYVVVGEGEYALLELVSVLEKGKDTTKIQNIWSKKNKKIIKNPLRPLIGNLDELPFPDKELFCERVPFIASKYTTVTSRGCPFKCTFCNNSYMQRLYHGSKYFRRRSVDNVIEELKLAKSKYNPKQVIFHDETFTINAGWLREFARKYRKEINLPYFCWVHPATINKEVVQLLKKSKCLHVQMGVQALSDRVRRNILHRYHSNEQLENAIKLLNKAGIISTTDTILGLPGQSEEEALETARFYSKNRATFLNVYWLCYYPKTEIVDIALNKKKISKLDAKKIIKASNYNSFLLAGNTYKKTLAKIRILILLTKILPAKTIDWLIDTKRYKYLPGFNSFILNPFLINIAIMRAVVRLSGGMPIFFIVLGPKKYSYFIKGKILRRN